MPSGVSYMLENRMVMRDVFPELFTKYKVSSVHQYPNKLYHCMLECVPRKTRNPHPANSSISLSISDTICSLLSNVEKTTNKRRSRSAFKCQENKNYW